jgi:hypothetical protein
LIKKLILTNIGVNIVFSDGSCRILSPIDRLDFYNVYSDEGILIKEISEILIKKMINSIFVVKKLKTIVDLPMDVIKMIFPFLNDKPSSSRENSVK